MRDLRTLRSAAARPRTGRSRRAHVLLALLTVLAVGTALLPVAPSPAVAAPASAVSLSDLRVEKKTEPIGVDVDRPRFSWVIDTEQRAVVQQSYRLRLFTDRTGADAAAWDSGVVASPESSGVEYDGPRLDPATEYRWTVDVQTTAGEATASSVFRSGLFDEDDWSGSVWIGNGSAAGEDDPIDLTGAQWIWTSDATTSGAPGEPRAFRRTVPTPDGKAATSADVLITADDSFRLFVNGELVGETEGAENEWQSSKLYTTDLDPQRNVFAVQTTNSPGSPAGLIATIRIRYDDGSEDLVRTGTDWLASKTIPAGFAEPGFDDSAWPEAHAIADYGSGQWGTGVRPPATTPNPAPLLRKEFALPSDAKAATLFVAAGGYADVTLNGEPVSDEVLSPGYTDYDDTLQYVGTDVTELVRAGDNAMGIELGRGFYGMTGGNVWRWEQAPWHDEPKVRAMLRVEFEDGTVQDIVTDDSWGIHDGPTVFDDLYGGETYDARLVQTGFDTFGFDDEQWESADEVAGPSGVLVNQRQQPIRITEELPVEEITEPAEGVYVVKFPRVIAGWVQYTVQGPAGTTIRAQAGEKLRDNGRPNFDNNGGFASGFQTDRFTLAGTGEPETWEPSFSYKGFQYIEVTGWPEGDRPEPADFTAKVVHTDAEEWGSFESSEPIMNKVHRAVVDTLLNNIHGIPTDTPMFEKNGWTGDAAVGAEMFMMNLDTHELFAKWMRDVHETRDENGAPLVIAPSSADWGQWGVNPSWHSAYVMIPWWLYQYGGDDRVISEQYDGMKQYIDLEFDRSADGIVSDPRLGDWVSPEASPAGGNAPEDVRVSATAYLYAMLTSMQLTAEHLGEDADAARFGERAEIVKAAFNDTFLDAEAGHYRGNGDRGYRQTHNVLALAFGMTPDDATAERVAASIVADIHAKGDRLNTGVLGTKYLLPVLTEYGYEDVALSLAVETGYPSWGYMVENGGTSMWEHWSLDARSLGHYFLGTVDDWFYHSVAGIEPSKRDGYRVIEMTPAVTRGMEWARAETGTPYGPVSTDWERDGDSLRFDTHVPVGATARITLPAGNPWAVSEGGRQLDDVVGVQDVETGEDGETVTVTVASGDYSFLVSDGQASLGDILESIDEFAAAVSAAHDEGELDAEQFETLTSHTDQQRQSVQSATALLSDEGRSAAAEALAEVLVLQDAADEVLAPADPDASSIALALERAEALRSIVGSTISEFLDVSATASPADDAYRPGESGALAVTVANGGDRSIGGVSAQTVAPAGDWSTPDDPSSVADEIPAGERAAVDLPFTVPLDAAPDEVAATAHVSYRFAEATVTIAAETSILVESPLRIGEIVTQPEAVEPGGAAELEVIVVNDGGHAVDGHLELQVPDGWVTPAGSGTFIVPAEGEATQSLRVFAPFDSAAAESDVPLEVGFVRNETTLATASTTLAMRLPEVSDPLDHIDLGDAADEQHHALTASSSSGTNSEAGLTRRYAGHLTDFSYFEFDMAVVQDEPFLIRAIETYDRAQTKRYKVYVDGEEVRLRQFAHEGGVGTETFQFLVPAEYAQNETVRIRFENQDDHTYYDPSIADVWTMPVAADQTAPEAVLRFDRSPNPDSGWFLDSPVEVTMLTADDRPGPVRIEYEQDDAETVEYESPVSIDDDGVHSFTYRAVDAAGNASDDAVAEVRIDTQAPETTAVLGDEFDDGVAQGGGTVSFDAHDAVSGVAATSYRIDDGPWIDADEVTVRAAGAHVIEYRSRDVAGNVEQSDSVEVEIVIPDTTPPRVSVEVSAGGENGWHLAGATATVSSTDDESGIDRIEYRTDRGDWSLYTAPIEIAEGTTVLEYRASDVAGNVSAVGSRDIRVDATAPEAWGWVDSQGRPLAVGTDTPSGVESLRYSADGEAWVTGMPAVVAEGLDPGLVQAHDRAGNSGLAVDIASGDEPGRLPVTPGAELLIESAGYTPGAAVRIELHSDPVLLGTTTVRSDGTLAARVSVPADLEGSVHSLVLVEVDSDGPPVTVPIEIAATGGSLPMPAIIAGILLLLAGAVLAVRTGVRRRRA